MSTILQRLSKFLSIIAGIGLTIMMLLTVADIIMRTFGHPILGTYEVVSLLLAIVIGFTIPQVSLDRAHIYMEILLDNLPKGGKAVMNTITRLLCIILFVAMGYNLFMTGNEFLASGEVSSTLWIPQYPFAYGLGFCCFIECLVFAVDIMKIWGGGYE